MSAAIDTPTRSLTAAPWLCLTLALCACRPAGRVTSEAVTLEVTGLTSFHTELVVEEVTGDTLSLSYQTLPANRPESYGNQIYLWEATEIPWSAPPLATQPITSDGQSGDITLSGLALTEQEYIVGYAVGPDVQDICTSTLIDAGTSETIELELLSVRSDSLEVRYQLLPGALPATAESWIGVWPGQASPYNPSALLGCAALSTNSTEAALTLTDLTLAAGETYTVVYFSGPECSTAATMLRFQLAPSPAR